MKKVLVVLLALSMVLGSFSFAFAAEFNDVAADNKYVEAINMMADLDVLKGDGDGTFRPLDGLKRSEAAVVLVKLLGQGAYAAEQSATKFTDVPASHWASGWINYASNLGLVAGYGDGTFGPEDQLTYNQWLTMVMRAEGYKDQYLAGEWPTNFVVKASSIGLVDASLTGSKAISRAEMAQVAFNSIDDKAVSYNLNILGEASESASGQTFLQKMGYTAQTTYRTNAVTQANADADKSGVLANYVGAKGDLYTSGTGVNQKNVTFIPSTTALTGVYTAASGTKPATFKTTDGTVYNFTTAGLAAIGAAPTMTVANGKDAAAAVAVVAGNEETINVTFVSGQIDSVVSNIKWTVSDNDKLATKALVSAAAAELKKTSGYTAVSLFGSTATFAVKEGKLDTSAVVVEGAVSSLADIEANDVLDIYSNAAGVAKVVVTRDTVYGTVTKVANSKYTIGGVQYAKATTTDASLTAAVLAVTNKVAGTYVLNNDGELFAYVADAAAVVATEYAFVLAPGQAAVTGSAYAPAKAAQIYLLTADGNKKVYDVNAKASLKQADGTTNEAITAFVAETLVEVAFNDNGEITKLQQVSLSGNASTKLTATGVLDGKIFAADPFVVMKGTAADKATLTSVSVLKTGTVSATGDLVYVVDANQKVVALVAKNGYVSTVQQVNTGLLLAAPALVANAEGVEVQEVELSVNGVPGTYLATANNIFGANPTNFIYVLTFTNGEVSAATKIDVQSTADADSYVAFGTKDTYVTIAEGGVQGDLVNYGTAAAPAYTNIKGATVYVANFNASGTFTNWSVGTASDIVVGAQICLYKSVNNKADADVAFVVPAGKTAPAVF